jgi:glycosyltransferase involved in cell wall biosynthesis
MERPVVGIRAFGPAEIIRDGETGVLVQDVDAAALAREVLALLADSSKRERLGRAGRLRVTQSFSVQHMVNAVESELERLVLAPVRN